MNPIPALAAAVREAAPDALILVDSDLGPRRRPVRDGRVGRRRRRDRLAEGVDGGARAWRWSPRRAAGLGRDGDGDDAALLPRPASAIATRPPPARRRGRPPIAVVYQVDEGLRLMQAEGGRRLRPPRGVRRRRPAPGCAALGFELFADRRGRLEDGHRRLASPTASTGRRSTARSSARGLVLAGGQGKLTGKIFRLGHLGSVTIGRDPRRDRRPRDRRRSSRAVDVRPGAAVAAAQAAALESTATRPAPPVPPREDPRRRAARAPRASSSSARHHEVDEQLGLRARRARARSCPTTTRSSSAARSRSTPS